MPNWLAPGVVGAMVLRTVRRAAPLFLSLAVVTTAGAGASGCSFGESGVEPPLDRIYLPGGLGIDPTDSWLYTVTSNSDLRFNAGVLLAINADKAAQDRKKGADDRGAWPECPTPGYLPEGAAPACCWDFYDRRILNCDEAAYVDKTATVRLGSFGARIVVEPRSEAGARARLYVAVRSEPSVTYVDVLPTAGGGTAFRCDDKGGTGATCDEAHKVRGDHDNMAVSALKLFEEPSALSLDPTLGLLYVGHLIEGLSVIDTCGSKPELVSLNRQFFSGPGFGVTSVVPQTPGDPTSPILVTGKNFNGNRPAEVQVMKLRGVTGPCGSEPTPRPAILLESEQFFSSAFFAAGTDIRGIVETADRSRAYLLHRNAPGRSNVPAVVEVDRSPGPDGKPRNRGVAVVETCAGATEMHLNNPTPDVAGSQPLLYVVCFEAGQVYVLSTAPLGVRGVINVGRGPTAMVFPNQKNNRRLAYVVGFSDNNISVLDLLPESPTENRVVQRIGFPLLKKR